MQTTRDVKADPVDGSVVVTLTVTLKLPIDASSEVGRLVFGRPCEWLGTLPSGSARSSCHITSCIACRQPAVYPHN